jgi:hypothetical protein
MPPLPPVPVPEHMHVMFMYWSKTMEQPHAMHASRDENTGGGHITSTHVQMAPWHSPPGGEHGGRAGHRGATLSPFLGRKAGSHPRHAATRSAARTSRHGCSADAADPGLARAARPTGFAASARSGRAAPTVASGCLCTALASHSARLTVRSARSTARLVCSRPGTLVRRSGACQREPHGDRTKSMRGTPHAHHEDETTTAGV